jgi:hypothetical protein
MVLARNSPWRVMVLGRPPTFRLYEFTIGDQRQVTCELVTKGWPFQQTAIQLWCGHLECGGAVSGLCSVDIIALHLIRFQAGARTLLLRPPGCFGGMQARYGPRISPSFMSAMPDFYWHFGCRDRLSGSRAYVGLRFQQAVVAAADPDPGPVKRCWFQRWIGECWRYACLGSNVEHSVKERWCSLEPFPVAAQRVCAQCTAGRADVSGRPIVTQNPQNP